MRLWIPGRLPGLNDIIEARRSRWKGGPGDGYNTMKKRWSRLIARIAASAGVLDTIDRGHFTYLFVEPNRKRDPSNIIAGGVKILEDSMQGCGLLRGDGWRNVLDMKAHWAHLEDVYVPGATDGALVVVDDGRCLDREDMIDIYQGTMKRGRSN